jgi:hypothetical protein
MRKAFLVLIIAAILILPGSKANALTWWWLTITESARSVYPSVSYDGEYNGQQVWFTSYILPECVIGGAYPVPPIFPLGLYAVVWYESISTTEVSDYILFSNQGIGFPLYYEFRSLGAKYFDPDIVEELQEDNYPYDIFYEHEGYSIYDLTTCRNYPYITSEYGLRCIFIDEGAIPLPPSAYLLGSGLLGLVVWRRFRKG